MAMESTHTRRFPDLFTDLVAQVTALFQNEVRLARAEVTENLQSAVSGVAMAVVGAVLMIPALVVLLWAAMAALVEYYGFSDTAAALIVGGVTLLVGLVLLMIGIRRLRPHNLAPSRTMHQLKQDAEMAKDQVRPA